ncbi:MAG: DEAD/DEAH box helicase [Victivallales bacterium]|nr:DEAD/DEAH box helicase [Victivallales bacterium]
MGESFESRLIRSAGEDNFKKGKQLLKTGALVCAFRNAKGRFNAVFRSRKGEIVTVEVNGADNTGVCSCGDCGATICEHAVATILHFSRFSTAKPGAGEEPARYRGLKYEAFTDLVEQSGAAPEAELHIYAESAFPHVPSKFENAVLRVKLVIGSKEYMGNLNNLRQLHFGKTLTTSLKISQFSQQDRQIIRFLSINANPDGSRLVLDAEQTAEFFHCLSGCDNFTKDGRRVIVHRSNAEPVMLYEPTPHGCRLRSSIVINGSLLPLHGAKVVTGRCGCWVGVDGEYWWVPATVDVAWLRSFLRTSEQECDAEAAKAIIGEQPLPVRLMRYENGALEKKKCNILYRALLRQDGCLELQLGFDYDGSLYPPDASAFGRDGRWVFRRDVEAETQAVDELRQFGFLRIKPPVGEPVFTLDDVEAIGIFCDRLIPEWNKSGRRFYLSRQLAVLSAGGRGVPEITLRCRVDKANPKNYHLEYELQGDRARFYWKEIAQAVKNRQSYWQYAGKIFRIGAALARFMSSVGAMVQAVRGESYLLQLPRNAVPFWNAAAEELPGAVPPEFYAFNELLLHPERWDMLPPDGKLFPLQATLRDYQKCGIDWMRNMTDRGFNVILADEMGLGKTLQALAVPASRLNLDSLPALVVCPTSLVDNWQREAAKFVPDFKVSVITGSNRADAWAHSRDFNLVITSYAIIKRDYEHLAQQSFSYMILDEAQHIKNPSTANAKICKSVDAAHRLVLTGTPLENSPEDLWSIFDFLHPDMLGSFNSFRKYYEDIAAAPEKQKNLAARVAPFILRRKKNEVCAELPPKQEQVLYCEFDRDQRRLYQNIAALARTEFQRLVKKGPGARLEILTILMRLRQVCCHPALLPAELRSGASCDSAKMELMKELVLENIDSGHKMLLFSQFTSLLQLIRQWLDEENIAYEYLDGATKNRQERVDNFNNSPGIPIFLLSLKAGGTGLNLTSADTVIIFDPWWNPAAEAQATDRTHRIGQTRPVTSMKLVVKDSVEERILDLQQRKAEIFHNLIENQDAALDRLSLEDLEYLFN